MELTKITATNFKGASFEHELDFATAIIGRNMSGKSAIVQAIRLALAGWLPECGKTARATWELSSGPEMIVEAHFDHQERICRRFWLEGSTVKSTVTGGLSLPDFEALPLLNDSAYFELTDSQRTEYLFERIKLPESYTRVAIIAECQRLSFEEGHTELIQTAKANLIANMDANLDAIENVQEWLAARIQILKDKFTYWNKRAKDTQGAVTTLAELKLREKTVTAAQFVEAQLKEAQATVDQLNVERGKLEAELEAAEQRLRRRQFLQTALKQNRINYAGQITTLESKIKLEKKKLGPAMDVKAIRNLTVGIEQKETELKSLEVSILEAKGAISEVQKAGQDLQKKDRCPYCHSDGKGWKTHLTTSLTKKAAAANKTLQIAEPKWEPLVDSIKKLEKSLAEFQNIAACNLSSTRSIETWEAEIGHLRQAQEVEEARRAEYQTELDGLGILPAEKDVTRQLAANKEKLEEATVRLKALQRDKDAELALKHDLRRAAEAELEHREAKAHVIVIKALGILLKDKREAMVCEAFGKLLVIANKVTHGILKAPLVLHEETIGMWNGSKFVPHRVFSGTEKALTYIAVAVALSSTAPLRLVILDEFGRLDKENQFKVLLRLAVLVEEEVIDQFIIVSTSLPKSDVEGLKVIKV